MNRNTLSTPLATALLASTLGLSACASSPGEGGEQDLASTSAALLADLEQSAAIAVLDSGHWNSGYVYHGAWRESFWVDLSVRNDAYDKTVGIVWSSDGWATSHTTQAHYKGGLAGGRERWGLDVPDFAVVGYGPMPEVEYAAFVTMKGETQWSVFRNHYIYEKVSVDQPVRLLRSSLSVDAAGRPVLAATVRALNVPEPRRVFVRATTDGWKTFTDAPASFDGRDFQLSLPLTVDAAMAEEVDFAVRFEASSEVRWDNNQGQNYALHLAPRLGASGLAADASRPAGGIEVLSASFLSDLPVQAVSVRIDGGPAVSAAVQGSGILYPFATTALADGAHAIRYEVTGAGGFQRSFAGPTFLVKNDLAAVGSWSLPLPAGEHASFDAQRLPDGSYLVLLEHSVARYAALGQSGAPALFAPAPITYVLHDLAVDGQGRAYGVGMDGTVVRWRADGSVDAGFGSAGALALTGTWGSSAICNVAAVEATGSNLYVLDSCNGRVLRLSQDGALRGEVSLAKPGLFTTVMSAFARGSSVWVLRTYIEGDAQRADLIELDDASSGAPVALRTVALDAAAAAAQAFAVTDGGFWVSTSGNALVRLDTAGAATGIWLGGGGDFALPGALDLPSRIDPLEDGGALVLSWGSNRVERIAPRAR